jgi:HlyD family secretion protein
MSASDTLPPASTRPSVFREQALARISSPERLDMAAAVVRPASWMLIVVCALVVAGAIIGGIYIDVPLKVKGDGILLSVAGIKEVVTNTSGQVKAFNVKVGDHVDAGMVVAQVEQPDIQQEIAAADSELLEARAELEKRTELQMRVAASEDKLRKQQQSNLEQSATFLEQREAALSQRNKDFEELTARGYMTKQRLLDARSELEQVRDDLGHNRRDLKQLDLDEESQKSERERENLGLVIKVSAAERKLAQLNERLDRLDNVQSSYAGQVAELKLNAGEVVERGMSLLTIIPDVTIQDAASSAPLVATIFVSPADGKKVRPGMMVEIIPATVRREENGYAVGRVSAVSQVPATQEGMLRVLKNRQLVQSLSTSGAPFEVRVELDADKTTKTGLRWSSSRGPDASLTSGTPCQAEVVTKLEPALQILFPATREFFRLIRS